MMAELDETVRLRDNNRAENPRKRRPSDNPESQKIRNQRRKETGTKQRGRLEFYYDDDVDKTSIMNKLDTVKMMLGEGKVSNTSTYTVLQNLLDFYLEKNGTGRQPDAPHAAFVGVDTPSYQYVSKEEALEDDLFVCTNSAIKNLVLRLGEHSASCLGKLTIRQHEKIRHTSSVKIKCDNGHNIDWISSPHVEGGKLLANIKMAHGYFSSGMLPNQYDKLCNSVGLGKMGDKYLDELQTVYQTVVEEEREVSQVEALQEEIALSFASDQDDGINIMTDARHCWRRNAKFTDVACLGDLSHKVLRVETVSKADDVCSQRHELIGVERVYEYLDSAQCPVIYHAHDNNASVTKFVANTTSAQNCLDTWHVTKNMARATKKITSGSRKMSGIQWHSELSDKAASIKTHLYWCMKNCGQDPTVLRNLIDNIVDHYQNKHNKCHETSRCKTDQMYEPTKFEIKDPNAETLLRRHLHSLSVYKNAESYCFCKDTHYVESFNNALLQYHDKRVCFSSDVYSMRIGLAILDWNENVDREVTSRQHTEDIRAPRRQQGRPVLKRKTYNFRERLLSRWINKMY